MIPRVVIISGCDAMDRFLIRAVEPEQVVTRIIRPVWVPARASPGRRPITLGRIGERLRGETQAWLRRRREARIGRLLFGPDGPPAIPPCDVVPASAINEDSTRARIAALVPDLLLVSGAPLLSPAIFSLPRLGTVNVHYGIAPWYRGMETVFWPLYLEDYDRLGVSLLRIDTGIDNGEVLARGYPALGPEDTEETVTAKCARLAAALARRLVRAAANGPLRGPPRPSAGACSGSATVRSERTCATSCAALSWRGGRRPGRSASRSSSDPGDAGGSTSPYAAPSGARRMRSNSCNLAWSRSGSLARTSRRPRGSYEACRVTRSTWPKNFLTRSSNVRALKSRASTTRAPSRRLSILRYP
jgi:methionyl-tRNA formyltransferase